MLMKCSYVHPRSGSTCHVPFDPDVHARYQRDGWRHYRRWLADVTTHTVITVWSRPI